MPQVVRVTQPRGGQTSRYFTRQAATIRLVKSLTEFLTEQGAANRQWLGQHVAGRKLAGFTPAQLRRLAREVGLEDRFEGAFARRASDRIAAALPKVLERPITDRASRDARWRAINGLLEREGKYAQMREREMARRAFAAIRRIRVQQQSPAGARWDLGPADEHTPECVAMAGKAWPWSVLSVVHPPVHGGCVCKLSALPAGVPVPGHEEAIAAATQAMALHEHAGRALLREVEIRAQLVERGVTTEEQLAGVPWLSEGDLEVQEAFEEWKHPRGALGRFSRVWTSVRAEQGMSDYQADARSRLTVPTTLLVSA